MVILLKCSEKENNRINQGSTINMQQNQLFYMQWDMSSQASNGFVFLSGSSHFQQGASF